MSATDRFPPLPLESWEDTKTTLHLFLQMVGKARMALHPKLNHWWHVTLYPAPRGLTTGRIPLADRDLVIDIDLRDHCVVLSDGDGRAERFNLPGLSVAGFHRQFFGALARLGVEVAIRPVPYDHKSDIPFAEDEVHDAYDPEFAERFSRVVNAVSGVFETFRGRFLGKSTPVHLFWHSFDLALTRFSGKAGPPMEGGTNADREAYSHEVISVGFWAGDDNLREPAFYAYASPEPDGLARAPLKPTAARWVEQRGSHMALLPYEAARREPDPAATILDFLESAYQGAARQAGWPVEDLTRR
jgi:hypothetical protein